MRCDNLTQGQLIIRHEIGWVFSWDCAEAILDPASESCCRAGTRVVPGTAEMTREEERQEQTEAAALRGREWSRKEKETKNGAWENSLQSSPIPIPISTRHRDTSFDWVLWNVPSPFHTPCVIWTNVGGFLFLTLKQSMTNTVRNRSHSYNRKQQSRRWFTKKTHTKTTKSLSI